jgi:two-component system, cell cycle sensor histidine kinase and response regulator CckA
MHPSEGRLFAGDRMHIVFVEDASADTDLAVKALRRSGFDFTWVRVDTADALRQAIRTTPPDLVISDYSLPELTGLDVLELVRGLDAELPVVIYTGALDDERAVGCLKAGAWDYVLKENTSRLPFAVREVQARRQALKEAAGARAALVQMQRLEATGRLAGGVSHDFNNLLTGILGYCDLLLGQMPAGSPYRADVQKIQTVAQRASTLTRQLLAFSRKQPMRPVPLNLAALATDLKKPMRTMLRSNIELTWELATDLPNVDGDPGQIEQAIYNLAVNAADAMPDGGRIAIRTHPAALDATFVAAHPGSRVSDCVALSVIDNGPGIDPEHLPVVFEPFVTPAGEATGLGLAAVYGIVSQSGGYVTVESEPGRGSTFTMYFPVSAGGTASPYPAEAALGDRAEGTETILTVEDDESLRPVLRRVLEGHGYRVLEAGSAREAIDRWLGEIGRIDLLLTDVILPGQNGVQLASVFRAAKPSLPVMFTTGYVDPSVFKGMTIDDATALIRKPYLPSALVRQIRQLLVRPPSRGATPPGTR